MVYWAKCHSMFSTSAFALPPLLFSENFQWKNFSRTLKIVLKTVKINKNPIEEIQR